MSAPLWMERDLSKARGIYKGLRIERRYKVAQCCVAAIVKRGLKVKSSEYIDALKQRHSLRSDYAASKLIGISPNRLSNYRTDRSDFDADIIPRIAELLDMDPAVIVADIAAARAKTAFERSAYERLASLARAAAMAASVTAVTNVSVGFVRENELTLVGHIGDMLETLGDNSKKTRRKRQHHEKKDISEADSRPTIAALLRLFRRTVTAFAGGRATGAAFRASHPAAWATATA